MDQKRVMVGMDKCKVALVFPDNPSSDDPPKNNYQGLMEWVGSVRTNDFAPIAGPRKRTFKPSRPPCAWTFVSQPLASGGAIACRYGRHTGAFRAWIEFNPSVSNLGELAFHFNLMLELGFETLHRYGEFYYCEMFVDVAGAAFDQYLYFDTSLRSAGNAYVPDGTQYLGSNHSTHSVTVYDKAKQLMDVFGVQHVADVLRIESKLKSHTPASSIDSVANPFSTIKVVDRAGLASSPHAVAQQFRALVDLGLSAQTAYRSLSRAQRAELLEHVEEELGPHWWRPDEVYRRLKESFCWMAKMRLSGATGIALPLGEPAYESLDANAAKNELCWGSSTVQSIADKGQAMEALLVSQS